MGRIEEARGERKIGLGDVVDLKRQGVPGIVIMLRGDGRVNVQLRDGLFLETSLRNLSLPVNTQETEGSE